MIYWTDDVESGEIVNAPDSQRAREGASAIDRVSLIRWSLLALGTQFLAIAAFLSLFSQRH